MNWKAFITAVIVTAITSVILIVCLSGCSGTGFDKRATLMPDRIGISIGQQRFKRDDAAWRGVTFNMQWDLK